MNETTPPITKNNSPLIYFILLMIAMPIFFGLGMGTGYFIWGKDVDTPAAAQAGPTALAVTPTVAVPQQATRYDVPVDDDPSIGPEDAPITIIEFSDYQCPYCQKWHVETFEQLMANYPGQIRLVYRDFPLNGHPEAIPAAVAANCAGEQGQYWEYHNALFTYEYELGSEGYNQYAADLGLDTEAFRLCIEENRYYDEVMADLQYATQIGVRATPTFFINGIPVEGAYPFAYFQQIIDLELAGDLD
ncbi:MAG: DsbA family protein [Chloroflexi bacterium]|nr:DsbA family protein [Chloroflexota bacterium]